MDRDHPAGDAVAEEVHRDVRERDRDHRVEHVRLARPEVVGELRGHRLDARPALELDGERLADVRLVAVPEGIGLADVLHRRALPDGALGGDDHRVVRRVQAVVLREDRRQRVEVVWRTPG